ncbi:hypothetical protein J4401_01165 [Candidatus Woesearchaeota archaeon]|nr:hypothetical protein [Candidatus Woesearchaeota archaeon]
MRENRDWRVIRANSKPFFPFRDFSLDYIFLFEHGSSHRVMAGDISVYGPTVICHDNTGAVVSAERTQCHMSKFLKGNFSLEEGIKVWADALNAKRDSRTALITGKAEYMVKALESYAMQQLIFAAENMIAKYQKYACEG